MTRPWMPIYWGDYTKKTQHLSTLEHGAYLLLIAHYWNTGAPIVDNDEVLRRITRTSTKQWKMIANTIRGFFIIDDGMMRHQRVESELQTALGVSTLQSSRSKQGWKTRKNQHEADASGIAGAKQITFTVTKKEKEPKGSKKKIQLSELSPEHIRDWLAEKNSKGVYVGIDPVSVLEALKDYCQAKGKTYKCYVAAYRNAFSWERFQPQKGAYNAKPNPATILAAAQKDIATRFGGASKADELTIDMLPNIERLR